MYDEVNIDGINFNRKLTRACGKHDYKPGDLDSMRSAIDETTQDITTSVIIQGCSHRVELEFGRADGTIIDIIDGNNIKDAKEIIAIMCLE